MPRAGARSGASEVGAGPKLAQVRSWRRSEVGAGPKLAQVRSWRGGEFSRWGCATAWVTREHPGGWTCARWRARLRPPGTPAWARQGEQARAQRCLPRSACNRQVVWAEHPPRIADGTRIPPLPASAPGGRKQAKITRLSTAYPPEGRIAVDRAPDVPVALSA